MKCQKCQLREANVQVNLMINNQHKKMNLCHECYEETSDAMNGMNFYTGFDNILDSFFNQNGSSYSNPKASQGVKQKEPQVAKGNGFLDHHGRNLIEEAKHGKIDDVIGRDEEIGRVIQSLNRRTKNNPVLIGEAGVGKTAIAEGFAKRIVDGKVPSKLRNKQVYELNMTSLVAGTSYRGQFEEKMKQLVDELQTNKDIILFIDELHMVVGAGSSSDGSMDAGNILKPALARGDLQIIGATTLKEYRTIEKDSALERRFQPIFVKEPSTEQAFEILKGIRSKYEQFHEVSYSDEVLQACVNLSNRYIQDRFLPDKAIDLMDEAGSRLNLTLDETDHARLKQRLEQVTNEKQVATNKEDYETAAKLRDEESKLRAKLNEEKSVSSLEVTVEHIQDIIESKTGIPVKKLQASEQAKMKDLQKHLAGKVIGQSLAVEKVAKAVKRSRAGLKAKNRPISFMFIGPTGVGKTELSKTLAEEMFGSKDKMIRLDMSEFMEKHSVSKLIGSPPGYVGHDEGGQLTEQVRRNPYSIILLDEIEKAHPDVQHMFLQILEDGRLTDSQGRVVTFKDTVIIMTSNAGVGGPKQIKVGFGDEESKVKDTEPADLLDRLGAYFKPEFLNRFDSIIEFNHLIKEDLVHIVEIMMNELKETLEEQQVKLEITKEAKEKLGELGYHPEFGARPLRRVIQDQVEDKITDLIIEHGDFEGVTVDVEDNVITVNKI